jgi:ABC-2 type transport system ATP-binding protein
MNAIEITNLTKRFGNKAVLDSVSFVVPKGSIVGFVGENGAGKTTTMKLILGLLKLDGGQIKVANEPVVYGNAHTNRKIGYLPDVPQFYSFMTATEYLHFCGKISGLQAPLSQRINDILQLVKLEKNNKKISSYSRGMKQRLGLAQALLAKPEILICDEPTSALDPIGRKAFIDLLIAIKEETTVLFSSHILSDVEQISDYVAILHQGKIKLFGKMDELKMNFQQANYQLQFATPEETERFRKLADTAGIDWIKKDSHLIISEKQNIDQGIKVLQLLAENQLVPLLLQKNDTSLEQIYLEVISSCS